MVGKMAVALAVALALVFGLAVGLWHQSTLVRNLRAQGAALLKQAQDAELRANAEIRRSARAAAQANAHRRAAEADLSRALQQLRGLAKASPEARAWLLQPIPKDVQEALRGCKSTDGSECP